VMAGAPENCGTASCSCGFSRTLTLSALRARAFTSIHSREDDVVDWRSCVDDSGLNFQVRGRHVGLIVNREVYRLIAEVLARRRKLPALNNFSTTAL
jgi:hypothetical protein